MPFPPSRTPDYPDDIFADTRMSFGDHIEELRTRLVRALVGLVAIMLAGFAADMAGQAMGRPDVGVGRPMMGVIVDPVESQVREFYRKRNDQVIDRLAPLVGRRTPPQRADELYAKLRDKGLDALTPAEVGELQAAPVRVPAYIPVAALKPAFGDPKDPAVTEVQVDILMYPAYLNWASNLGEAVLGNRQYLTTLSVQEAFVVYFKVSLLCGVVLGSPWIFYQIWAFVAAGLYPHERKYVYTLLGPSVGLFVAGALICQFLVLPGAVKALLAFNGWIGLDPDLRLNEWLGFALVLPVVFGVSFQTPLVMVFLNRIGTFSAADYVRYWRTAFMALAVFAAVLTPTPDVFTMMYLFAPMFGLYLLGVAVCHYFPPDHEAAWQDSPAISP